MPLRQRHNLSELLAIGILLITTLVILAIANWAGAECRIDPSTGQWTCPSQTPSANAADITAQTPANAHCRIHVTQDGSTGSGTLIDAKDETALVITCAHLFDDAQEQIICTFPNGRRFGARLIERDRPHDLAMLIIKNPGLQPIPTDPDSNDETLTACGYGPQDGFRALCGRLRARATAVGARFPSIMIDGSARPGDSGGGILNRRGFLVGVIWGTEGGRTYANTGRPLRDFLAHIRARWNPTSPQQPQAANEENRPTLQPILPIPTPTPADDTEIPIAATQPPIQPPLEMPPQHDCEPRWAAADERFRTVEDRLAAIESAPPPSIPPPNSAANDTAPTVIANSTRELTNQVAIAIAGGSIPSAVVWFLLSRALKRGIARIHQQSPIIDHLPATTNHQPTTPNPPTTTPIQIYERGHNDYVPYETSGFAKAYQWATGQIARKYPGCIEALHSLESLIQQHLSANPAERIKS